MKGGCETCGTDRAVESGPGGRGRAWSPLAREAAVLGAASALGAFALYGLPALGLAGAAGGLLGPALAIAAYLLAGRDVLAGAARNIARGRVFDELFLMSIATLGALAIGQYAEALGVMVFYKIGEALQNRAAERSRESIRSLLDLRPDVARLRRGEAWELRPAGEALTGDRCLVLPGERLPLDGIVLEGEALVDASALTGEPLPLRASAGTAVLAGSVAMDGSLVVEASRPAGESSAARIADLVEGAASAKARPERFVTRFAAVYTPIVVGIAAAIAFLPPLLVPGERLGDWAYRALVMLVISCPCALVVSVPLGYFCGLGGAARRGILVKGSESLDALARARTAVFDKTGTLTEGAFRVLEIRPAEGFDEAGLLTLAAAAESRSRHPVAASIREEARARGLSVGTEDEASELRELAGAGVVATVGGRRVAAGNDRILHLEEVPHECCEAEGTTVHVAVDGRLAGSLLVGDAPRPDAARAIAELARLGVGRTVMLSGDAARPALAVAAALGLTECHAGLLPEDKLERLGRVIGETARAGGTTIFVGDGINDAPALALADVGVAMGGGTDAAVESADVVLMTDEPSRVAEAVSRARRTRRIVSQNIALALGIKAAFLILGAAGVAVMWEAVFADVGVTLLAVANSLRAGR